MFRRKNWQFWLWWILANALGELLGLGVVVAIAVGLLTTVGEPTGAASSLGFAALMVLLGAFEGCVLGLAQAGVLRTRLPRLRPRSWIVATIIGAVTAWGLGMVPSVWASLGEPTAPVSSVELATSTVFLLASLMGAVLGVVLAWPQGQVLQRYVNRAHWWLPANAIAWAGGMPIIFWVAGSLPPNPTWQHVVGISLVGLTATGAVVGTIHGSVLLWLLPPR